MKIEEPGLGGRGKRRGNQLPLLRIRRSAPPWGFRNWDSARAIVIALCLSVFASGASAQIKIGQPGQTTNAPVSIDPARTSLDDSANAGPGPSAGASSADAEDRPSSPDLLSQYEKPSGGKPRWVSKLLGLLGAGGAPEKQAAKAYGEGDYDKAMQKYAEAQLDHPESQALAYNIGNAEYRKKKYEEAIKAYQKALHGEDAGLAASSYYNLGNAHFRKGEFSVQSGKQEGIEDYREAMAMYKKSLELRPDNRNAKRNIEVVQARIKELLEKQKQDNKQQQGDPQKPPEPDEQAKAILARAMQLVEERRYAEAKTLLQDLIQKNKTAATYQSHLQRIDDVLKILRGEAPTPPQTQDPRASQPGVGII